MTGFALKWMTRTAGVLIIAYVGLLLIEGAGL